MAQPIIVDGRNLYEPESMRQLGFRYRAVGRPTKSAFEREVMEEITVGQNGSAEPGRELIMEAAD